MSAADQPPCVHAERAELHALGALGALEERTFVAHLGSCEPCRRQLEATRATIRSFAAWPTDLLRPAEPLWERVASRLPAEPSRPPQAEPHVEGGADWQVVAPGISVKLLSTDLARRRVSMLVRLAPRTDYPAHRHAGIEELHLLDGVLEVDDRILHAGDYLRSEVGTSDARVYSETGCTCVLITSVDDALG